MNVNEAFHEIFGDSDSGDSDFEEPFLSDSDDDEVGEGTCNFMDGTGENDNSDGSDFVNGPGENRQRAARAGDDVAREEAFRRAYQDDWLVNFNHQNGPLLFDGDEEPTEYGIFSHFFDGEVIDLLVRETNRYAATTIENKGGMDSLSQHSRFRKWKEVQANEMKAFLAIMLLMGIDRRSNYELYWTTEWTLEAPGIRSIMSRDRFYLILTFLHCTDNAHLTRPGDENHDRRGKIKEIMDLLVDRWQTAYYPDRELSVDETIIPFKGRTAMKVYKPNKPHKWGLNCWNLAEAKTGYVWKSELYQGKRNNQTEVGLYHDVVTTLCQPVYNRGHRVYMDNLFTSPTLFDCLSNHGTGACGTLRTNRVGTPDDIKKAKLKASDPLLSVRDGKALYVSWFDKRQVNVVSTVHNATTFKKNVRARGQNTPRNVDKPVVIECYTKFMGGVDRADQGMLYYLNIHKTLKWWKKVFVYLLEVSYVNSWIIWKALHPGNRQRPEKFRFAIVNGLLEGHVRHGGRAGRRSTDAPNRLTERHFLTINHDVTPAGRPSKPDCVVCSNRAVRRHQTEYICIECNKPMCPAPCFRRYHTLMDYKADCVPGLHK